jgi:DeoR family glycerol-3-phosphate regulon repressor
MWKIGQSMLSRRQTEILRILEAEGSVSIAALASRLDVSLETVRRDVKPLSQAGSIVRVHGAVGLAGQIGEAPFEKRMRTNASAKQAIARTVAAMIRDGDSVMLDTGTTTSYVARELTRRRRLLVVTNSSDIARTLATVNGNRVYMAGGELRSDSGASFGKSAIDFIGQFSVDHAIISASAVDETGVIDLDLEEAEIGRLMLTRAKKRIVVTDSTKFGRRGLIHVCAFTELDQLVTDAAPPAPIRAALTAAGTAVMLAGDGGGVADAG